MFFKEFFRRKPRNAGEQPISSTYETSPFSAKELKKEQHRVERKKAERVAAEAAERISRKLREESEEIEQGNRYVIEALKATLREATEEAPERLKATASRGGNATFFTIFNLYPGKGTVYSADPIDAEFSWGSPEWPFFHWYSSFTKTKLTTIRPGGGWDTYAKTVEAFAKALPEYRAFILMCRRFNYQFSFEGLYSEIRIKVSF